MNRIGFVLATLFLTMAGPVSAEHDTSILEISAEIPERCSVSNVEIDLGKISVMSSRQLAGRGRIDPGCTIGAAAKLSLASERVMLLRNEVSGKQIPVEIALEGMEIIVTARLTGDEPAGVYRGSVDLMLEW